MIPVWQWDWSKSWWGYYCDDNFLWYTLPVKGKKNPCFIKWIVHCLRFEWNYPIELKKCIKHYLVSFWECNLCKPRVSERNRVDHKPLACKGVIRNMDLKTTLWWSGIILSHSVKLTESRKEKLVSNGMQISLDVDTLQKQWNTVKPRYLELDGTG